MPPETAEAEAPDRARRLTIREMCARFEVTPRTLRFYEEKGLLAPEREGQARLYTARDRARLALVLRGRRFGFSLEEIGELLALYDVGDGQVTQLSATLEAARRHHAELCARRGELDAAIAELEAQMSQVSAMLAARRRE